MRIYAAPSTSNKQGEHKLLQQPTLDKQEAMRKHGMAQGLREQSNHEMASELSLEERFALLVDRQMNWR